MKLLDYDFLQLTSFLRDKLTCEKDETQTVFTAQASYSLLYHFGQIVLIFQTHRS